MTPGTVCAGFPIPAFLAVFSVQYNEMEMNHGRCWLFFKFNRVHICINYATRIIDRSGTNIVNV